MPQPKLSWMKLYTGEILADESLKSCSMAAKGFFLYMLSLMHRSVRRGFLCQANGQPWTLDQLSRMTGCSTVEVDQLTQELLTAGVFSVSDDSPNLIFSRRMVKEARTSESRSLSGKKGALAKHLPQQNSGKQVGKTDGKQVGNALKSDSLCALPNAQQEDQIFSPVVRGCGGEEVLPQQNLGKTESEAEEIEEAAKRCTEIWRSRVLARPPESFKVCLATFKAMLMQGHSEKFIVSEIPANGTREWLKAFCDRLDKQVGIAPGGLFTGPAPTGAAKFLALMKKRETA